MLRRLGVVVASLLASALTCAQEVPPPQGEGDVIWHEVQPGDTLESITQQYLGAVSLWRENWRLNPEIPDPGQLTPGQKVLVLRRRPPRTVAIEAATVRVERQAPRDPWLPAHAGELLQERDSLRAGEDASAAVSFEDGMRLRLAERTQIALWAAPGGGLAGDLVAGEAEVDGSGGGTSLVAGDVRVTPGTGASRLRVRRTASGVVQVMAQRGGAEVVTSSSTLSLDQGFGVSMPKAGRASSPQRLLAAPLASEPAARAVLDHANPRFYWEPVPGAASYLIEIYRDPECTQLIARAGPLAKPRWASDGLPLGEAYWRVTAIAPSGLDGMPSAPSAVEIRSLWRRPAPPR